MKIATIAYPTEKLGESIFMSEDFLGATYVVADYCYRAAT
jgi:hypothetical protein